MNKFPTTSILIVTWNNKNDIDYNLTSVLKTDYPNLDTILVVDNDSSDGTADLIEKKFPGVELIRSTRNDYFTGGNNRGYSYIKKKYNSDFIAVLNPDTKVSPDWISQLVEIANKDNRIGIIGPKIMFFNNDNEGLINSTGLIYDGYTQAYDRGVMEEDKGQYDKTEEVEAVSGTCMLIRSEMISDLGELFWSKLRMYLEDLELCIRARKRDWNILYTANTTVLHTHFQSTKQSKNVRKKGWLMRNWVLIALRHYPFKSKLAVIRDYITFKFGQNI